MCIRDRFVVDLGQPGCVEQILEAREILAERRVTLTGSWDGEPASGDDPFAIRLPTLLVANKADAIPDIDGDLAVCRELGDLHFPTVTVAAATVTVGKCRSPSSRQTARSPSMSGMASALFATSSVGRRIANGSSPDAGSPSHEPVSVTRRSARISRASRICSTHPGWPRSTTNSAPSADWRVLPIHGIGWCREIGGRSTSWMAASLTGNIPGSGCCVVNGYAPIWAWDPVSATCRLDLPVFGGPRIATCAAPSGWMKVGGPPRSPPFEGPASSSFSSLILSLIH